MKNTNDPIFPSLAAAFGSNSEFYILNFEFNRPKRPIRASFVPLPRLVKGPKSTVKNPQETLGTPKNTKIKLFGWVALMPSQTSHPSRTSREIKSQICVSQSVSSMSPNCLHVSPWSHDEKE
jgi:hypothetical protein